jgi:4,4'-diaponeurosporenoate glycosyltransferase
MAAGGHAAIRGAILDDLALGSLFQQKGLPVTGYGGRGLIHFRMYPEGFCSLWEGWTKNFASGASRTHPLLMVMIVFWIGGAFSSVLLTVRSSRLGDPGWIMVSILMVMLYMLQMVWLARRTGDFHPLALVLYPLLHVFFVIVFVWSLFRTRVLHSVRWRGRSIKL